MGRSSTHKSIRYFLKNFEKYQGILISQSLRQQSSQGYPPLDVFVDVSGLSLHLVELLEMHWRCIGDAPKI